MNDDAPRRNNEYAPPAQNRPFGEEMARETERVFRRAGGEPLDEYLRNINSYLTDLNSRLGVQPADEAAPEQAAPEQADEAAPEQAAPEQADEAAPEQPAAAELPETDAPDGGFSFAAGPRADRPPLSGAREAYRASETPPAYQADGYAERRTVPAYGDDGYPEPYGAPSYLDDGFTEAYDVPSGPASYPYEEARQPSRYTEAVTPEGYVKNDWQAAVAHPELYPDLDDPAVRGRGRKKKERRKKERAPKVTSGGKSRFSFVTTWLNLGLYAGWTVLYFVCLSVRSVMFASTQSEMAMQGVANYSLSISSPLFTVLKILMYFMPVVVLLWMGGVLKADKRGLPQVDRRLLIASFAADLLAGAVVLFDVAAANMVF